MPSTSQLTSNSRSMNGLNTINANAVFTDTLEVNTLTIDTAGTTPTRPNGDNTTNIANTQFVTNAVTTAGANYVDLTSTQTITGAKTFSNANTVISGALRNLTLDPSTSSQNTFRDTNQVAGICNIANNTNRTGAININTGTSSTAPVNIGNGTTNTVINGNLITNNIVSASATTDINIGTALTTGDVIIGGGSATNLALSWGGSSNSGILSFRGGSFNLASTGVFTASCGAGNDTNLFTGQAGGILNIATGGSKTGAINIGTGASVKTITLGDTSLGSTIIRGEFAQLRPSQSGACSVGDNMTSGFIVIGRGDANAGTTTINIGNGTLFTGAINVGAGTSGNAPITIGSTASTTQTATHNAITTFSKIPSCAVAPTTADHLCNKTYVDSVGGSILGTNNAWTGTNEFNTSLPTSTQTPTTSTQLTTKTYVDSAITTGSSGLLASNNVWTNENDFTNVVKVQDPTVSPNAGIDFFSSITPGIVMNGAPGVTSALSGVNLNTNTLTVPIKNNQSLIRIRIPMNIAGFGVPSFYFGQLDIIFNSITAITILRNGSFYKTVSVFDLLNFTETTKSWTGWSQKGENARAYVGDVQFELAIVTANTSVDTYTIGITMDVAVNAGAVGLITPRFLCNGDFNFTTTHATTTTGTTYISTDPVSFFPYQINFGNNGNYIIGNGDTYIKTIQGGALEIDAQTTFTEIPQCAIASSGDANDLINYQTLTNFLNTWKPYFNPVGTIITFAGSSAPPGYLLCDGSLYAQSAYPSLFSVIFNTYGGSFPNFRVPNTQGIFISSAGSQTLNSTTYTRTLGARQNDVVEDHKHTYSDLLWYDTDTGGGSGQTIYVSGGLYQTPGGDTVGSNGDGDFSNRLTKATYPANAVNPGTPAQQWNAPTNVSAITGTETFPANIALNHYIKF